MAGVIVIGKRGDKIATVRLRNPDRMNAISALMWRELSRFAADISQEKTVRAVVLLGSESVFSAGADITGFETDRESTGTASSYDDLVENTCQAFEAIAQPTICAIRGPCIGAGASLAASCDIRVASNAASFAVPAARLGLGYDIRGIQRFHRVFGPGASAQLLFTTSALAADDVHRSGAIQILTPDAETEASAFACAERIAQSAPMTVQAAKLALRAISGRECDLWNQAVRLAKAADDSDDYREGRAAFREKRKPDFRGI